MLNLMEACDSGDTEAFRCFLTRVPFNRVFSISLPFHFMLLKKITVHQNQLGFLYHKKKLINKLNPGIYLLWDFRNHKEVHNLPQTDRILNVVNQEVLTKDNVALRFSFTILYKIENGELFLSQFQLERGIQFALHETDQLISGLFQLSVRRKIRETDSEQLTEKLGMLDDLKSEEVTNELKKYGLFVTKAEVRDITFPKNIQDLFLRPLEAKIRAKADLENARTAVATARALKNAAEMMKGDDSIRFMQYLEALTKIASKGKHTFMIGDIPRSSSEK